jgi:lipopolysaccharide/colanic/teichoic acid biosynthesis glycosyltransferase
MEWRAMSGASKTFDDFYPVGSGTVAPAFGRAVPHRLAPLSAPALAGWACRIKRAEDLVLGAVALCIFLIPMVLIALCIVIDSPGSILFRQQRIGLGGRPFEVFKFRTMRADCGKEATCRQATRGDPRITRVGRLLRRFSLDEFPQLVNVLRGEMSLVGPRPHAPGTCAAGRPFEQVVPVYQARHRVLPGMTGLAQVRGWRGETETEEKLVRRVESDLEYIVTWSLWLDFRIIALTLLVLVSGQNAY